MKTSDLRLALEIFQSFPDGEISTELDKVFVGGPAPGLLFDLQNQQLENAGWKWSELYECWIHLT